MHVSSLMKRSTVYGAIDCILLKIVLNFLQKRSFQKWLSIFYRMLRNSPKSGCALLQGPVSDAGCMGARGGESDG